MTETEKSDEQRFEAARSAFRAFAEQTLETRGEALAVSPSNLRGAEREAKVGTGWAMQAVAGSARVRGWALPSEAVATLQHNLGLLLDSAGVWDGVTKAYELAKALVWGLKRGHQLYVNAARGAHGPKLEMDEHGHGTLVFFTTWRNPEPAGAIMPGSKSDLFRHVVKLKGRAEAFYTEEPWRP